MSGAGRAAADRALTQEQESAAARRSEDLLLSAAAGSGKTLVLVERFVRAVREDGLAPGRILAITFTERAAGELRERIRARLLELGEREAARDTEAAFLGTFHGFCARLLRAHATAASLDPEFAILDDQLAGRLRSRALRLALGEFLEGEKPQAVDLVAAYGIDRVGSIILSVHAELRSRGQREPRLPPVGAGEPGDELHAQAAAACAELDRLLVGFSAAYERLKRERGAVDFDDLELLACELLQRHESVRASWAARFELVMVDEFQDTNQRQLELLRCLQRDNLFTVGDELQSIYGFRHADVSLFRQRRARLAQTGGSLALTQNFRSAPALLDAVNALFRERFDPFTALVPAREVGPGEPPGPRVELLVTDRTAWGERPDRANELARGLPAAAPWRHAEARALAARIAEIIGQDGVAPGEIVVLLRAGGDLRVYERALIALGVPTLAAVGAFWEHQQIGDLLAYLRALANPLDELAVYGVLASPLVGLSSDSLALLAKAARERGGGLWQVASASPTGLGLPAEDSGALAEFCSTLVAERASAPLCSLSELIERAVHGSSYREHVLRLEGGERRMANIHKLLRLARRFEAAEGRDLRGFLDHVDHLASTQGAREAEAPVDGADAHAVRLMSIHAAKGLEFPVVCVADLGRAPNTMISDLLVDGERVGLRLARLDGERATPALAFEELAAERAARDAQEEDRILYVAMTRARERLLLSGALEMHRWPEASASAGPMAWLAPALVPELPELMATQLGPDYEVLPAGGGARVRAALCTPWSLGTAPPAPPAALPAGRVPRARAPEPAPPAPAEPGSLSYTALSELERCGYRYYLQRVLGLAEVTPRQAEGSHGLSARDRGTLVHRLLETTDFTLARPPSAAEVALAAEDLGMRTADSERQEIAGLMAGALRSPPAGRIAAGAVVGREMPFAFSPGPGEPLMTGVIDLLLTDGPGRMLVVDYKSDRVGPDEDIQSLVERSYAVQRLIYALALLRTGAQEVEVAHWFLQRPEEWATARYAGAERSALESELAGRVRDARSGAFQVSPRPHRGLCLTCPGRSGLCSWSDQYTLRQDPDGDLEPGLSAQSGPGGPVAPRPR